eukprot:m51a1_g12232 hypothetical protein (458) ;mRNA; r:80670-82373
MTDTPSPGASPLASPTSIPPPSLAETIDDIELRTSLSAFLSKRLAQEALIFECVVQTYVDSASSGSKARPSLAAEARRIARTFLEAGAPSEINIDGHMRKKLLAEAARDDFDPTPAFFDEARSEARRMIQAHYDLWLATGSWKPIVMSRFNEPPEPIPVGRATGSLQSLLPKGLLGHRKSRSQQTLLVNPPPPSVTTAAAAAAAAVAVAPAAEVRTPSAPGKRRASSGSEALAPVLKSLPPAPPRPRTRVVSAYVGHKLDLPPPPYYEEEEDDIPPPPPPEPEPESEDIPPPPPPPDDDEPPPPLPPLAEDVRAGSSGQSEYPSFERTVCDPVLRAGFAKKSPVARQLLELWDACLAGLRRTSSKRAHRKALELMEQLALIKGTKKDTKMAGVDAEKAMRSVLTQTEAELRDEHMRWLLVLFKVDFSATSCDPNAVTGRGTQVPHDQATLECVDELL